MKPAPFVYERPGSVAEAVHKLVEFGSDAKVLAGGQSLIPLMAFRLLRPRMLIDIGAIADLRRIEIGRGSVRVGACATHRSAELELGPRIPLLAAGLHELGHVAIRNVGTVGGSLAHADPASEWGALAIALDGTVNVTGPAGDRRIPADGFFLDWMQPDLRPGEIVTSLDLPLPSPFTGSGFVEVARRRGDFALSGAAVALEVTDGTVVSARVGLLGAGLTPIRAHTLESALVGLSAAEASSVAESVDADIEPLDDQHAPARYKRTLARVVVGRAIGEALGMVA